MKCTTCGHETQPGAKFCVQCGTTIVAAAAPAGMVPLAASSVTSRLAAIPPASSTSATASRPAYAPSPTGASATAARPAYTPPPAATPDAGAVSAAPASSMRMGMIAGVLALVAVVGIGAFIAYKMLIAAPPKEPVTATETRKPAESTPAPSAADASKDGAVPASTVGGAPMNNTSAQPTPAATPSPDSATATATRAPDVSKTATGGAGTPKSGAGSAQTKAGAPAKADAPMTAAPATPPSRQAATAAPAVHPPPTVQVDRWELMRQAHEACNNESLFDRLGCHHRVGQQYCKGYWGTVPECPAGAYGDRANN